MKLDSSAINTRDRTDRPDESEQQEATAAVNGDKTSQHHR